MQKFIGWTCGFILMAMSATAMNISFHSSEKIDALLLLNVLSDDKNFNGPYQKVQQYWLPLIKNNPLALEGFNTWKNSATALCYLLSTEHSNNLDGLIKFLKNNTFIQLGSEKNIEAAYFPYIKTLQLNSNSLLKFLEFLQNQNFTNYWKTEFHPQLDSVIKNLTKTFNIDAYKKMKPMITDLLGINIDSLKIYISCLSNDISFTLLNNSMCISIQKLDELNYLIPHELSHQYNPSPQNIASLKYIADSSSYYKACYDRIYNSYNEGTEEEFVMALGLWISVQSELMTKTTALRKIKNSYMLDIQNRGAPIAGIIFDVLYTTNFKGTLNDYDKYVKNIMNDLKAKPNVIQSSYNEILTDIAGTAGMLVQLKNNQLVVTKTIDNYPAKLSGIMEGDVIIKINNTEIKNRTLDAVLDLLSGKQGDKKEIEYKHGEANKYSILILK